ncbi:MAG TPA: EutN/CcmL family microcompartment protein [Kofleriaceae bacterium]|nr:EutN/CcmL family microcompartment protein [Kofleriaceae bacterium]HMG56127.1 EutN/CcmL family microcompartment protein [Kofleriaceae bacterium]
MVAPLWATVKHPAFAGRALFVVQPLDERGGDAGGSFVAIDHVQAGIGDRVLVLTEGNGVRQILKAGDTVPIRSIIVGVVDHVEPA